MTGAQRPYLKTLSEEAKMEFDDKLTKAEASKRIDELQKKTDRGKSRQDEEIPALPARAANSSDSTMSLYSPSAAVCRLGRIPCCRSITR